MNKQFLRVETLHGSVHYFNSAYIVSITPRNPEGFSAGAAIEVLFGENVNKYLTAPGKTTEAITDWLGFGR